MKTLFFLLSFLFLIPVSASSQSVLELGLAQSMSVTGKGSGQDAAINPFYDCNSLAIIKNIGKNSFVIRVQYEGEIIERVSISIDEIKEITLLKGYELYLDSELKSKAKVKFKKQLL